MTSEIKGEKMQKKTNQLRRVFDLLIETLIMSQIMFVNLEERYTLSKNNFLSKNSSLLVDICCTSTMAWAFGVFIYTLVCILELISACVSYIYNLTIAVFVYKSSRIELFTYYPSFNIRVCLGVFILLLSCTLFYVIKNRKLKTFRVIKELDVIIHLLNMLKVHVNIKSSDIFTFVGFVTIFTCGSYLFFPNVDYEILISFWSCVYLMLNVYSTLERRIINTKKFLIYFLIAPVMLLNFAENTDRIFVTPSKWVILVISIFFVLDRIVAGYLEFREYLFTGEILPFIRTSFTENDAEVLFKKLAIYSADEASVAEKLNLIGVLALKKKVIDFELARDCFIKSIEIHKDDSTALFYLGEIYASSQYSHYDLDKAIKYYEKVKKLQIEQRVEFSVRDIDILISYYLYLKGSSDYDYIMKLLNETRIRTPLSIYLRAVCLICKKERNSIHEIKIYLNYLAKMDNAYFEIPYWNARLELLRDNPNYSKIHTLVKEAKKLGICCEDIDIC